MTKLVREYDSGAVGFRRVSFAKEFDVLVDVMHGYFEVERLCVLNGKQFDHFDKGRRYADLESALHERMLGRPGNVKQNLYLVYCV